MFGCGTVPLASVIVIEALWVPLSKLRALRRDATPTVCVCLLRNVCGVYFTVYLRKGRPVRLPSFLGDSVIKAFPKQVLEVFDGEPAQVADPLCLVLKMLDKRCAVAIL